MERSNAMPYSNMRPRAGEGGPLTGREQEILALLSAGTSPPDIAARLGVTLDTVKQHVTNVYAKIAEKAEGNPLTRRELEILALVAAGDSTPDIAKQLGISPGTVKAHLTSVYKKIGAKNRVQAARYYFDHLAPPSEA
jgi:DNA-binding CsgD family transcriptional regulator